MDTATKSESIECGEHRVEARTGGAWRVPAGCSQEMCNGGGSRPLQVSIGTVR